MDSKVTPFLYGSQEVRVVEIEGEPWFVAADVAAILGYRMASDMTRRLDEEDRGTRLVRTPSGEQMMSVISEPGLYAAVMASRIETAKPFRRWVTSEVLPAIRRTGSYGAAPALRGPELLARAVLEADVMIREREARIAELEPAASSWVALVSKGGDHDVRHAAQILARDGFEMGQQRLFRWMREHRWLDAANRPYQRVVDHGWLRERLRSFTIHRSDGEQLAAPQVRVTVAGVQALREQMRREARRPVAEVGA